MRNWMRNPDVESHAVRISVGLQTADRHLTSHFVSLHTTWANCGTRTNLLITFTFLFISGSTTMGSISPFNPRILRSRLATMFMAWYVLQFPFECCNLTQETFQVRPRGVPGRILPPRSVARLYLSQLELDLSERESEFRWQDSVASVRVPSSNDGPVWSAEPWFSLPSLMGWRR